MGEIKYYARAILNKDYAIIDPLPEDVFGANVNLSLVDRFTFNNNYHRCIAA